MNKPNFILLTIDTLRADMLNCYGYNTPLTPNMDRLAASGIRFEQAISGGLGDLKHGNRAAVRPAAVTELE